MGESESEIVTPAEPDVVEIEVPEPEAIIETETEDDPEWQQTDPIPDLRQEIADLRTELATTREWLMGTKESNKLLTSLLQSALPGLQVLATLADETTDRKTRQQINQTMRGRR